MSYNPARQASKRGRNKRKNNPHAGVKHSDIVRRRGVGSFAVTSERENTLHGFTSTIFQCDEFTQRAVCIYAGNNTGIGFTEKGNRTIRVVSGTLNVTYLEKIKKEGETGEEVSTVGRIESYPEGHTVNLPAGIKYSLASTGTADVEMIVTETTGYNDEWKSLEDSSVRIPDQVKFVHPDNPIPVRRHRSESKAYQQAAKMSGSKVAVNSAMENRKVSRDLNPNSATVVGVNPKPSGPPPQDD